MIDTEGDNPKLPSFEVKKESGVFHITSPFVKVDAQKDPYMLELTIQKQLTPIGLGTIIESITIDDQSSKLKRMTEEARVLTDLPEKQRQRPLLAIVGQNMKYAYPWVMEQLANDDPELAASVDEKTSLKSWPSTLLTLSEVVDLGYGICRHLSVVMLVLAKSAGLQGAHMAYQPIPDDPTSNIINVVRKDTGKPLFLSIGAGEPFARGHTYLEILMGSGEWIPVDPTTGLIGDTEDGLATFKEANYQANVGSVITTKGLPDSVYAIPASNLQLRPGESQRTGNYKIGGYTETVLGQGQSAKKYRKYEGPLDFQMFTRNSYTGTVIEIKDVAIPK